MERARWGGLVTILGFRVWCGSGREAARGGRLPFRSLLYFGLSYILVSPVFRPLKFPVFRDLSLPVFRPLLYFSLSCISASVSRLCTGFSFPRRSSGGM